MRLTKEQGVIIVAKVLRLEGAESGSDLYIEIYLKGKTYYTSVDQECQSDCIGNYFFIRVMTCNPVDYPILYGHQQVPDCKLKNVKEFDGWKNIPDCNNYMYKD